MALWITATLAAAFFQNLRNALQRHVSGQLSVWGVTFSRFLYGFPLVLLFLCARLALTGETLPAPTPAFAAWACAGGLAQIAGNFFLVYSFSLRNFAVATTYSKTEAAQSALMSAAVLQEPPAPVALLGIVTSFAGVVVLSMARSALTWRALKSPLEKSALLGLASGAGLAFSAVCYRAGALALPTGEVSLRAAVLLAVVMAIQIAVMAVFLRIKEPQTLRQTFVNLKSAAWIGAAGAISSFAWFTAMAIENVAHVRAVGQIELLFAFIASHVFFKERSNAREIAGMILVCSGILLVFLGAGMPL